jgi:hypothetical protein
MYSFFWDCIDNYEEFNEGQELKLLPITETKKNMIVKSLDSSIIFLKHSINDKDIMNTYIKPKELYEIYCQFIKDTPDNKKFMLTKESFLEKLKDLKDIVKFEVKKINKTNPTNYIYINREMLIKVFTEKHYFNEYDDVNEAIEIINPDLNVLDKGTPAYDKATEDIVKENNDIKKQIEEMKKLLELLQKQIKPNKEEPEELEPETNNLIDDDDIDAIMAELDNTFKKKYKSKK